MRKSQIFIKYNTPSLKNSKIKTKRGIFPSKTVSKYLRNLGIQRYSASKKEVVEYKTRDNLFRKAFEEAKWKKPKTQILLGFHFIRGTRHKCDFGNMCQIILDLMTAHDYIEDDNMDYVIPIPLHKDKDGWYSYNKDEPGVIIKKIGKIHTNKLKTILKI